MKKSVLALAVSTLAVASVAQAAPQANTFYVGGKIGWASFHDGLSQIDSAENGTPKYGLNRNSVAYGLFGGYQINDYLAAELGYEYFGRVRGVEPRNVTNKQTFKHVAHGTTLALKASYPVIEDLDVYGKVGLGLVNNYYKTVNDDNVKTTTTRFQPSAIFGAGLEYDITPKLSTRLEWQWVNNVGKAGFYTLRRMDATDYRPDIQSVTLGLTYRFGQTMQQAVSKNYAFNTDVLFDFGKSNLRDEAVQTLDAANTEIANLGVDNPAIQVNGYTDRIGTEKSNLRLSQRRAENVANYLVSKGNEAAAITAVGYGEANPVTGNTCDAVKGRKALIACLAPDRRVEVQVQGTKEVEM